MVLLQRKLYLSNDPEGVQHFPGGWSYLFQWGPNANFNRHTYTCVAYNFPVGGPDPLPPFGSAHV